MKRKSILISGGMGFIGRQLAEHLRLNNSVTIIDNLKSSEHQPIDNVTTIISDVASALSQLNPQEYDLFYHLGEFSRVEQSLIQFDDCMTSNFGPLAKVLEFCRRGKIKLVYSGSSTKFTKNAVGKDLSPYTWSKAINTDLIMRYSNWYELNFAICYFYNVFGDSELSSGPYSTVVAKFIAAKKLGQSVSITSPGSQLRNFTHINDTIKALVLIGDKGVGDGYCIANPKSYSIVQLAEMLDLEYHFSKSNPANRLDAEFDLNKMKALGWSPSYQIIDYLKDVFH